MSDKRAHFWRLGRLGGGYAPVTNGLGENSGWTFTLLRTPRWRLSIHRVSRLQAEREAARFERCPSVLETALGTFCICDQPVGHDGPHRDGQEGTTWNDRDAA